MTQQSAVSHRNMILVPAGEYVMGSDLHYPEERPTHSERVEAFRLDAMDYILKPVERDRLEETIDRARRLVADRRRRGRTRSG